MLQGLFIPNIGYKYTMRQHFFDIWKSWRIFIGTHGHVEKWKIGNLPLWFLPLFSAKIWMFIKVCLSWSWNPMHFKAWLKSWSLHSTRLTLSLLILSHICGEWLMQHNCCPVFFLIFRGDKYCYGACAWFC